MRFGCPYAAAALAGTWEPPASATRLTSRAVALVLELRRRRALRSQRGAAWIAGYVPNTPFPWAERAVALADYASRHGTYGMTWSDRYRGVRPHAPHVPPWASEADCSVCLEPFSESWPAPTDSSRAPAGRWHCSHAVCRGCDVHIQNSANDRCPLCRADRRVHMLP